MVKISVSDLRPGYDIVVVGFGSSAASFARYINDNLSILIIESRSIPRVKPCTGVIAKFAHSYLEENKMPKYVFEDPTLLDVEYLDWDNNLSKYAGKGYYNTDRHRFDSWMSEVALKKKNIHVIEKTVFEDFVNLDNKLLKVIIQNGENTYSIVSRYLIGCDGALSSVRRKIVKTDIPYYLPTKQMALNNGSIKHPLFIFDKDISDYYSWLVPKGDYVEIGAGVNLEESKKKFDLFLKKVKDKFGLEPVGEIQSAVVLRPRSMKDIFLGFNNVLICGEAAGLITPSGAEGISFALISGKFAAQSINDSFDSALREYEVKSKILKDRLKNKFEKSKILSVPDLRKKLFV